MGVRIKLVLQSWLHFYWMTFSITQTVCFRVKTKGQAPPKHFMLLLRWLNEISTMGLWVAALFLVHVAVVRGWAMVNNIRFKIGIFFLLYWQQPIYLCVCIQIRFRETMLAAKRNKARKHKEKKYEDCIDSRPEAVVNCARRSHLKAHIITYKYRHRHKHWIYCFCCFAVVIFPHPPLAYVTRKISVTLCSIVHFWFCTNHTRNNSNIKGLIYALCTFSNASLGAWCSMFIFIYIIWLFPLVFRIPIRLPRKNFVVSLWWKWLKSYNRSVSIVLLDGEKFFRNKITPMFATNNQRSI